MIKILQVALTISLTGMCVAVESHNLDLLPGNILNKIIKGVPQGEDMHFRGNQLVCMSGPFYRKEAAKSLRLVNRRLAIIFSNETSPLKIYLRDKPEKLQGILSNPSIYFPLSVIHEFSPTVDHIKRLILIQPNLYSLSFFPRYHLHLSLDLLAPLTNLQVLHINCGKSQFPDLGPVTTLIALKALGLGSTAVDNLSSLRFLTSLTSLNLAGNHQIRDLGPLSNLTTLTSLNLRSTKVKTLGPIASLYQLLSLDLSNTMTISTFKPLSTLTNLESLDVDQAVIDSYSFLPHLVSLKEITIEEGGGSGRDGNYRFFSTAEEAIGFRVEIIKHDEDYDY